MQSIDEDGQAVIPGAEASPWARVIERKAGERMQPRKPQRSLDFGLFAEGVQLDIIDAIQGRG